jgi:hypothetical protein
MEEVKAVGNKEKEMKIKEEAKEIAYWRIKTEELLFR